MNSFSRLGFAVIVPLLLLASCSAKKAPDLTAPALQAFDTAAPEAQQTWTLALEAGKTNDYVRAEKLLDSLFDQALTQEQRQAVRTELAVLNQRLSTAAEKGDPAAKAALQELRQNPPSRRAR